MDDAEIRNRIRAKEWLASGRARALRVDAGLTLEEVAREVGVADGVTVCRWESGTRSPQGRHAASYGALLGRLERQIRRATLALGE